MDSSPDLSLKLRRGSSDSRDSFYMDFAQGIDSDIEEVTTTDAPSSSRQANINSSVEIIDDGDDGGSISVDGVGCALSSGSGAISGIVGSISTGKLVTVLQDIKDDIEDDGDDEDDEVKDKIPRLKIKSPSPVIPPTPPPSPPQPPPPLALTSNKRFVLYF